MSRYTLGSGAEHDLDEIRIYLRTVPARTHSRIATEIGTALRAIAAQPYLGRGGSGLTRDFGFEVRSWRVSTYRVFYRLATKAPEILAILHTARDHAAILRGRIQ